MNFSAPRTDQARTESGTTRLYPWGNDAPSSAHGVFDFSSWDPEPAGSHPSGASAWGIEDLVGNGWEWTGTPFGPFPGFRQMASYPEYSADFFDGEHMVMKGASPATAAGLLRPTFRNWFRAEVPVCLCDIPLRHTRRTRTRDFVDDVEYYLTQRPRQLPSRYFYDALGSALFEAICELPWYRITRAELGLLERYGQRIFAHAGSVSRIVELGPGNGAKLKTLVEAARHERPGLTLHLVDVSRTALERASRALDALNGVEIVTHAAPYEVGLASAVSESARGQTLALFLGSNIGNFDRPGAGAFLQGIRGSLGRGDTLIVGADLVKPEPELLLAYDDPLGVTAAFNRNLLVRINRELGGNIDLDGFTHRALWNEAESRVEMHLVSLRRQRLSVTAAHLDVMMDEGETIWTESSYKYTPAGVVAMLEEAGFRAIEQWVDGVDGFALTLVRVG